MSKKDNKLKALERINKLEKEKQSQLNNGWVKSAELTQKVIDALNVWL